MTSPQDQFGTISTTAWYSAMQAQGRAILAAMTTTGFSVTPESWIETQVQDVPVLMQVNADQTVTLKAGSNTDGTPVFEWKAPLGWLD